MTDEQKASYVFAQSISALIEALAMHTENTERISKGLSIAYGEDKIYALIGYYGIHSNTTLDLFHRY